MMVPTNCTLAPIAPLKQISSGTFCIKTYKNEQGGGESVTRDIVRVYYKFSLTSIFALTACAPARTHVEFE